MKTLHYAVAGGLLVSAPLVRADSALYISPDFAQAAMPALNAWCSSCAGLQIIGDRFTLSARSQLTSTEFAIKSNYGSQWQIHIAIFDTQLHQLALSTALPGTYSVTALGNEVALVHAPLPSLTLEAGDYYVAWWDDRAMGITGYTAGGSHTQYNLSQHTELGNYGAAFRISGVIDLGGVSSVAEPASGAMLLAGLALLGGAARRRWH
ncbi:MAG: PEP-CTERM sorting domain-containing protein [Burkholderiaceae bacterium]|nr:PEP-CTERM sorting domain-containing protein [Burkholderiaceae bacterium]